MSTLLTIGLVILGIILFIGIIRVIVKPSESFVDFLFDIMLLDWLTDGLSWVFEAISDIDFD